MGAGAEDRAVLVGLISDTHDTVPAGLAEAFAGVTHIVHAGDVGADHVLDELRAIAPVTAVRGNCDHTGAAADLPIVADVEVGGVVFRAGHTMRRIEGGPRGASGARVLVTGHTHRPAVEPHGAALHVNPGSAGDDRGRGTWVAVALVSEDGTVEVRPVRV